jgi:hypothetical protein
MGKLFFGTPDEHKFLSDRLADFKKSQANSTVKAFFLKLFADYFTRFPVVITEDHRAEAQFDPLVPNAQEDAAMRLAISLRKKVCTYLIFFSVTSYTRLTIVV